MTGAFIGGVQVACFSELAANTKERFKRYRYLILILIFAAAARKLRA